MSFDDRKKTEEKRYEHEQELAFKIRNRRNRLFGLWIAETYLGKTGDAAMDYAKEIVMVAFERPGDSAIIDKVRADLAAAGADLSDHLLDKHLKECGDIAKEQVMRE